MTRYLFVWIALVGLTLLSFAASMIHLGAFEIAVALGIAVVKSVLVLLFFMHLAEQRATSALVAGSSVLFVALLVGLVAADVMTRQTFPRAPAPASAQPRR